MLKGRFKRLSNFRLRYHLSLNDYYKIIPMTGNCNWFKVFSKNNKFIDVCSKNDLNNIIEEKNTKAPNIYYYDDRTIEEKVINFFMCSKHRIMEVSPCLYNSLMDFSIKYRTGKRKLSIGDKVIISKTISPITLISIDKFDREAEPHRVASYIAEYQGKKIIIYAKDIKIVYDVPIYIGDIIDINEESEVNCDDESL